MLNKQVRLQVWNGVVLLAGLVVALGMPLHFSAGRPLWSDELFGWMLLRDGSVRHMLLAWRMGADGGGLWFYLLGRLWLGVFGATELSFRMFSAAGFYVGFAAVWLTLRRFYPNVLLAAVLFAVWFGTWPTLPHYVEGRFYGLLTAGVCLLFAAVVRAMEERRATWGVVLGLFGATLLTAGTHPFGVLYSGLLLLAVMVWDRAKGWGWRWRVYGAVVAGWSVLLVSVQALRSTAAVGKPHFWTTKPNWGDLGKHLSRDTEMLPALLVTGLVLLAVARLVRVLPRAEAREPLRVQAPVLLATGALLVLPLVVFVKSQFGTALFVERYMLPTNVVMVVVSCTVWTMVFAAPRWRPLWRMTAMVGLACLYMVGWAQEVNYMGSKLFFPNPDFTKDLQGRLPGGEPVVVEAADLFDVLRVYQPRVPAVYLMDWAVAVDPQSPLGDVSGFHEMETWKKLGYLSGSIEDSGAFLATTGRFAVVHDPQEMWLKERILDHPEQWRAERVGVFTPQLPNRAAQEKWTSEIWQVERR